MFGGIQVFWLFGKPVNHYVLHKYLIWQDQCRELGLDAPPIINDDSKPTGLFSMAEPSPHSTTFPQSPSVPSRVSERKQHGFFEGTLTAGVGDDVISLDAYVLVSGSGVLSGTSPFDLGYVRWALLNGQDDGVW